MKFKILAVLLALAPIVSSAQDGLDVDPAIIPADVVAKALALQERALVGH